MKLGFLSVLGIVFIVLKLTAVIAWSWWLVLLPFWGGVVGVIILLLLSLVVDVKNTKQIEEFKRNNPPRKSKFQQRLEEMAEKKARS